MGEEKERPSLLAEKDAERAGSAKREGSREVGTGETYER